VTEDREQNHRRERRRREKRDESLANDAQPLLPIGSRAVGARGPVGIPLYRTVSLIATATTGLGSRLLPPHVASGRLQQSRGSDVLLVRAGSEITSTAAVARPATG
jgi:hypothetical protein